MTVKNAVERSGDRAASGGGRRFPSDRSGRSEGRGEYTERPRRTEGASKVEVKVQPVMRMDFVKAVAVGRVAQQWRRRIFSSSSDKDFQVVVAATKRPAKHHQKA